MPDSALVSIIIPAFNEEVSIADTLQSIQKHPPHEQYEVIVVDNGSTDNTPSIAEKYGAKVVSQPEGTIASVRNSGVVSSKGDILVFLDADVLVTEKWSLSMPSVINELIETPMLCTGSRCLPPENNNWFNRHWFGHLAHYDAPYINSGHLITTRTLFDQTGGFSEHLKTAEDYDFCIKAKAAGASIKNNPQLPVIHLGYPQTIKQFIRRERWHGREDFETLSSFISSKIGWIATFHLLFLICAFLAIFTTSSILPPLISYFLGMYLVSIALTLYKFNLPNKGTLFQTAAIFYVYIWGRTLALIDRFISPQNT